MEALELMEGKYLLLNVSNPLKLAKINIIQILKYSTNSKNTRRNSPKNPKILPSILENNPISFSSLHPPNRLIIKTPEQYKQLENGEISHEYDTIIIEASAHPNVFSLPKHYWNAPWSSMFFVNGKDRIHLFTRWKEVWAKLITNGHPILNLPHNYTGYEVFLGKETTITSHEIDYILTWTNAERLLLGDRSNVAYELYKRIDALKAFDHLYKLELTIQRNSYNHINLIEFLKNLHSLKIAHFRATSLSTEQFSEFIHKQRVPKGWKMVVEHQWITYKKELN